MHIQNRIFQLIPFLEYCFQWLSYAYALRNIAFRNISVEKRAPVLLKMLSWNDYKGQAIFIPGFYSNCLAQAFYNLFNQWSMVLDMLFDLKIIRIFIWKMRLENSRVSSTLCFLLIKLLGTTFTLIVVMGLKHCRKFPHSFIYAGISGEF